jgi:hypothetical protein
MLVATLPIKPCLRQRLELMRHIYGGGGEGLDSPTREASLLACMELSSLTLHPPPYLANPQRWVPLPLCAAYLFKSF